MLAKTMALYTELDVFKTTKQRSVFTAVLLSIFITTAIIVLIPSLVLLAKMGMYPLILGMSFVGTALLHHYQGEPMWELTIVGQGFALVGIAFFIAAIIL